MSIRYIIALVLFSGIMFLGTGCGNARTTDAQEAIRETSYHDNEVVGEEASVFSTRTLLEIVETDDDHFWVVNLDPTDGDYYFGDLAKGPGRGWYGSYGGEYITVELDAIHYLDDRVRFTIERFAIDLLDDGTMIQIDSNFYDVGLTRGEIIAAIEAFQSGATDVVLLEAQAVPRETSE